jgi:hypothetical protein
MCRKLTLNEVKERLIKIHGKDVVLVEDSYKDYVTKAIFIDKEFGEWMAKPYKIISQGQDHPSRRISKMKKTCFKQFGVEHPSQSDFFKKKKEITTFKNYGVINPFQSELIKKSIRQTNLYKHGFNYPSQNKDIRLKAARSANKIVTLKHWFSGEDIYCQGGWETLVVEYFNKNCIDYNWQVQTFMLPDGRTYTPDCYLPEQDIWIEIKGWHRGDSEEKWNWFHKEYSNSEIWDKNKLREMNIL